MSKKAPSLNSVIIAGNLVKEPELKEVGEAKTPHIYFTVANNQSYKDKNGEWQDVTTFFDVEAWAANAQRVGKGCHKGDSVLIEGALKQNRWQDANGNNHSKLFIKANKIHI